MYEYIVTVFVFALAWLVQRILGWTAQVHAADSALNCPYLRLGFSDMGVESFFLVVSVFLLILFFCCANVLAAATKQIFHFGYVMLL